MDQDAIDVLRVGIKMLFAQKRLWPKNMTPGGKGVD